MNHKMVVIIIVFLTSWMKDAYINHISVSMTLCFQLAKTFSCSHVNGLVQERRNSIANALELPLSCTNPSIFEQDMFHTNHDKVIIVGVLFVSQNALLFKSLIALGKL